MSATSLVENPARASQPTTPDKPDRGPEDEAWTVVFRLAKVIEKDRRAAVLNDIDVPAAFVQSQDGSLSLSVGVNGPMDQAIAFAVGSANSALEATGPVVEVMEVRMVAHGDLVQQMTKHEPVTYYGVTECARALGVSRQRAQQLLAEEKLPAPDALVAGKPAWEAGAFEKFAKNRLEGVRTTPNGSVPPTPPRPIVESNLSDGHTAAD